MKENETQTNKITIVDELLLEEIDNANVAAKKLDAAAYMVDSIADNPTQADPNAIEGLALMIAECARTVERLSFAAYQKMHQD